MLKQAMARILVVEDEQQLAKIIDHKLKKSGYETEIAYDGQEALEKLKSTTFDLILLDLVMPKTDGFTVLDTIQEQHLNTKVIVLSNLNQEEDILKVKNYKVVDYLVKSDIPLSELVEKVKESLKT